MRKQINPLLQLAEPLGILQPGNQVKLQRSCAAWSCVRGLPGVSIIDVIASTRICCSGIIAAAATCRGFDERIMNLKNLEDGDTWAGKWQEWAMGQEKRMCV